MFGQLERKPCHLFIRWNVRKFQNREQRFFLQNVQQRKTFQDMQQRKTFQDMQQRKSCCILLQLLSNFKI